MQEFKFDVQMLIEGQGLSEDAVIEYITANMKGDCLLVVGNEELLKLHFHTNEPWEVLKYCDTLGDVYKRQIQGSGRSDVPCSCALHFPGYKGEALRQGPRALRRR